MSLCSSCRRARQAIGSGVRRRRHQVILSVAAGAVTVFGLVPAAEAGPPGPGVSLTAPHWRVVVTVKSAFLAGLVAPSLHSVWALGTGGVVAGKPGKAFPVGVHWNGRGWSKVSFPQAISNTGIGCAAASSARSVWAFAGASTGGNGADAAGALRLVRGRWKLVKSFPPGIVTGCLVVDATDVWVFGDAHVAPGTGTWHLHGRTWTHLGFHGYLLDSASAITRNDIWGAGSTSFLVPVVARWNGRSWVRNKQLASSLPKPGPNVELSIDGITAISNKNVWLRILVSRFSGKRTDSFLVLHWTGGAWHHVGPSNRGYFLPGAVRGGDGTWWSFLQPDAFGRLPSGVRHLVHGRWVKVPVKIAGCLANQPLLLVPAGTSSTMLGLQFCPSSSRIVAHVLARGPIR